VCANEFSVKVSFHGQGTGIRARTSSVCIAGTQNVQVKYFVRAQNVYGLFFVLFFLPIFREEDEPVLRHVTFVHFVFVLKYENVLKTGVRNTRVEKNTYKTARRMSLSKLYIYI